MCQRRSVNGAFVYGTGSVGGERDGVVDGEGDVGLDSAAVDDELDGGERTGPGDRQGRGHSYGEITDQEDDDVVMTFTVSGSEARVEEDFSGGAYIDDERT